MNTYANNEENNIDSTEDSFDYLNEDFSAVEEKAFFSDIPELKGVFQITSYTTTLTDATAKDTGQKYKRIDINIKCKLNEVIASKEMTAATDFIGNETSLFLSIRKLSEDTELNDKGKLKTFLRAVKLDTAGTLQDMLNDIVGCEIQAIVKKSNSYLDSTGQKVEGRNRIRPESVKSL